MRIWCWRAEGTRMEQAPRHGPAPDDLLRTASCSERPSAARSGTSRTCAPPFGTKRPQVQILSPRPRLQDADLRKRFCQTPTVSVLLHRDVSRGIPRDSRRTPREHCLRRIQANCPSQAVQPCSDGTACDTVPHGDHSAPHEVLCSSGHSAEDRCQTATCSNSLSRASSARCPTSDAHGDVPSATTRRPQPGHCLRGGGKLCMVDRPRSLGARTGPHQTCFRNLRK